ncbi:MAG: hypothetical protein RLZZ316_2547 [Bacteroidota bacterium]|jgi:hypothetical protein
MKSLLLIFSVLIAVTISRAQSGLSFLFSPLRYIAVADTIPGNFINFAILENTGAIQLEWAVATKSSNIYFAVERSENGSSFTVIGVVKNESQTSFNFRDEAPPKGLISYRLKQISSTGIAYSHVQSTQVAGNVSCKFYPNPVDKMLIVRSDQSVELIISDGLGKQVLFTKLDAGLRILDVSLLEPGIYFISLYQKEANRIIRDKLIKK